MTQQTDTTVWQVAISGKQPIRVLVFCGEVGARLRDSFWLDTKRDIRQRSKMDQHTNDACADGKPPNSDPWE